MEHLNEDSVDYASMLFAQYGISAPALLGSGAHIGLSEDPDDFVAGEEQPNLQAKAFSRVELRRDANVGQVISAYRSNWDHDFL